MKQSANILFRKSGKQATSYQHSSPQAELLFNRVAPYHHWVTPRAIIRCTGLAPTLWVQGLSNICKWRFPFIKLHSSISITAGWSCVSFKADAQAWVQGKTTICNWRFSWISSHSISAVTKYPKLLAGRRGTQMESEMTIHWRCKPSLWHSVYCTLLAFERLLLKTRNYHGASPACDSQTFTALAFERLFPILKYHQALIQSASSVCECETQTFSVFAFHLRNHCPYQATDKVSWTISRTGK